MRRNRIGLTFAVACTLASFAHADVIDNTWLGGSGSWNDPTKWSAGVVPNNNAADTFRVVVPSGTVTFSAPSGDGIVIDAMSVHSGARVQSSGRPITTNQSLHLDGVFVASPGGVGTGATLSGGGTLSIALGGFHAAGDLVIPSSLRVSMGGSQPRLSAPNGTITNHGTINGGNDDLTLAPYVSASGFKNLGTIDATNGGLGFGSTFTRTDLGNLVFRASNTYVIYGNLNNNGEVFQIGNGHRWAMKFGGRITSAVVNVAPGGQLTVGDEYGGGRFDNVVLNGTATLLNRLDFVSGVVAGNADLLLMPDIIFGVGSVINSNGSLTINASATVRTETRGAISSGTHSLVNHGTVRDVGDAGFQFDSSPSMNITAASFFNHGTVVVGANAWTSVDAPGAPVANLVIGSGGVVDIDISPTTNRGLLEISGALNIAALNDRLTLHASPAVQNETFYRIIKTGTGVIGQFDFISPNFEVEYRNNSTEIWARFVPEPSSAISAASLATLFARRRRHRLHIR